MRGRSRAVGRKTALEGGQTLSELGARFEMSRFGVMQHLKQLEDARLVVTRRRGREKLHFLNPVPIRLVHDRWVSKYAEPWVAGLSDLKQNLERQMEKIYEIYIRTTPELLWQAITDPADKTVPYQSSVDAFGLAEPPKYLVTLFGQDHGGSFNGEGTPAADVVVKVTTDFLDAYVKGDHAALARLAKDATAADVASFKVDAG